MKYLGLWKLDSTPEVGTVVALKSTAEAHYRISVLSWAVREQAAGRSPGVDWHPPAELRRHYWALAYDQLLRDLQEHSHCSYIEPLEILKADALASVTD
jgi:hypothetical protein